MAKPVEVGTKPEKQKRDGTNITVTLNEILYGRCRSYIIRTKQDTQFVMADLVRMALRDFLDRAESPQPPPQQASQPQRQFKSAADIAASIPGVRLGIPEPPTIAEPFEVEDEYSEEGAIQEFGRKILMDASRGLPWWRKADWRKRIETLREMKDAAAGT